MGRMKDLLFRNRESRKKPEPKRQHDPIQYSDETRCRICGKIWDTNDAEPPECD